MSRKNKKDIGQARMLALAKYVSRSLKNQFESLQYDPYRRQRDIRTDRNITLQEFRADKRIAAYYDGDNAYENDQAGAIIETAVRLAVGIGGGMPFFIGPKADAQQKAWNAWAENCGFVEGENWNDELKTILTTLKIHGDCLLLIDSDLTDGKLRLWDADQIVNLQKSDFEAWCSENGLQAIGTESDPIWRQVEGAVVDPEGRVRGYFVTALRNRYAVRREDAPFLPIGLCRRVSRHRRIGEYRGTPPIISNADLTYDTRQLIKTEVDTARNYSQNGLILQDDTTDQETAAVLSAITGETGDIDTDLIAAAGGDSEELSDKLKSLLNAKPDDLKAIENKMAIGHVKPGTQIHQLNNSQRPSPSIQQWQDKLADINGQRIGVLSCLSRGRADNSYSSGQIELAVSWAQFQEDQYLLLTSVVKYAVEKVIGPGADFRVEWPQAFEIDPQKAEATFDARLKGGRTTFQEILGPDWRRNVDAMKEFMDYCAETGVDPKTFSWLGETSSGNAKPISEEPTNAN